MISFCVSELTPSDRDSSARGKWGWNYDSRSGGFYWRDQCNFPGNDLYNEDNIKSTHDCVQKCKADKDCDHFTWIGNSFTIPEDWRYVLGNNHPPEPYAFKCFLKKGGWPGNKPTEWYRPSDAQCGFITSKTAQLNTVNGHSALIRENCNYYGNGFTNFKTDNRWMCIEECGKNSKCTHFVWTFYDSRCYLKAGKNDVSPVYPDSWCGLMQRN